MYILKCNYKFEIERLRDQLIKVASEEGMHADRTIILSRKLDLLINKFVEQENNKNSSKCVSNVYKK
ncbi:aspartyl-phosphate phosphatase Spo0E family protein [Sporosarcina sp. GW1-11]|uniref:aspartyl-phosphate phosphatase Spo0E family protein n=1 Tax=Sporosarcina sp. GW1-11 TaxID=2899126 RepID=UPI003986C913